MIKNSITMNYFWRHTTVVVFGVRSSNTLRLGGFKARVVFSFSQSNFMNCTVDFFCFDFKRNQSSIFSVGSDSG